MKKKKCALGAVITAAAALAAGCSAPAQEAAAPQDGQVLVDINFDDGSTGGFVIYTNGGSCEISNDEGALAVDITGCGSLDYANQVYWDGLSLVKDCEYTYSFDISCDIDRSVEYRLQLNGGDYHAYVGEWIPVGPETVHVSTDWVMTDESDPAPRIAFNMGKTPDMAQDPGPHRVRIDNILLTVKDASGVQQTQAQEEAAVPALCQAGFRPDDEKRFVIADAGEPCPFSVIREDTGEAVFEGTLSEAFYDAATDTQVRTGDFTEVTEPGMYHIETGSPDTAVSPSFAIGEDVYDDLRAAALRMLTLQRCGTELPEAEAGVFAHGACHTSPALIPETGETKDVTGGWHDAGDYGRYVVPGAKTIADLFAAAELAASPDDGEETGRADDVSALLEEARWELDWMLKMQDEESGGVYHKVTCRNFPGAVMPEEETDELVLSPISAAATCDFAAVMAKASRVYRAFDPSFADQALAAAKKAWSWISAQEHLDGFHNPADIVTGEYGDEDVSDEYFWAAAELYLAGGTDLEETVRDAWSAGPAPGLGWDKMTTYAAADLAGLGADTWGGAEAAEDLSLSCLEFLTARADALLEKAGSDAYGTALGTDYPWGSNMSVANDALTLLTARRLSGRDEFEKAAVRMLHYLLGCNGMGMSYVSGFGTVSPAAPHHRPSQAAGTAMPGMLAGGPNSHLEDPYAQGALAGKAPALCYVDNDASYSTNEVAIYWNSPLVAVLWALR